MQHFKELVSPLSEYLLREYVREFVVHNEYFTEVFHIRRAEQ